MTTRDEGKTHHFGDDCPGGHRAACVDGVEWDDQLTAQEANERDACPFCQIIAGKAPATVVRRWDDAIAIVPLNPVVEGHLLVIPEAHVEDFTTAPWVTAGAASHAAALAADMGRQMNLITSKGRDATQSVFHLHLHLVPRAEDDGLALPWYSGRRRRPPRREPPTPAAWPSIPEGDGRA